jgi:hypothetical protein
VDKNQINSKATKIHLAKNKNNTGSYLISNIIIDDNEIIRLHRIRREKYFFNIDKDFKKYEKYINYFDYIENQSKEYGINDIKRFMRKSLNTYNITEEFKINVENIRNYVRFNEPEDLDESNFKCCCLYIFKILENNDKFLSFYAFIKDIQQEKKLSWAKKINLIFAYYQNLFSAPGQILEIVNFSNIKENCAYSKAIKLLKDIINNIQLKSKLFSFFYLCNSGCGCNRLYTNEISYKLSMLTEKQIKLHLLKILPKVIFRYSNIKSNEYGYILNKDGIMCINEGKIFNEENIDNLEDKLLNNIDNNNEYVIPILMNMLHELYGHGKNMIRSSIVSSPVYINSINRFTFGEIKKNDIKSPLQTYYIDINGESGRVLDFFISEKKKILLALKFSYLSFNELMSYKLWVRENFDELNKRVEEKTKNFEFDTKLYNLAKFPTIENDDLRKKVDENMENIKYWSDDDYDENDNKLEEKNLKKDENKKIKKKYLEYKI